MEDLEPRDSDEGAALEAAILGADRAFGAESSGTTAEEALEGETLDEQLAEEEPDRTGGSSSDGTLSLTEKGTLALMDDGPLDDEDELVGDGAVERDEFASPEEAALTVRDRAPGATDHEDQHGEQDDED